MILVVAVVIAGLLVGGVSGVAVHHAKAAKAVAVTPAGFLRVADPIDHFTLAIPAGWRVVPVTTGQLNSNLTTIKAQHPELSSLLDLAQVSLQRIQAGVFAIDVTTRTTLFSYGVDAPSQVRNVRDIATSGVIDPLVSAGAKNVHATARHLPVADAEQVEAQLLVGTVTVSELLDYFVLDHRVVAFVMATPASTFPRTLMQQVETSLAVAP